MRGIYGKARAQLATVRIGAEPSPMSADNVLEGAKVGAVIMLSAVAVVTAGKVLSPTWARSR